MTDWVTRAPLEGVHSRGVLHAEEPDGVGAFVGGGIAVKEIPHRLVKMAFTVFCSGQQCGRLALGGTRERGYGVDEMGQG